MPFKLRHIHLPANSAQGLYPSYARAGSLQEVLRRRFLDFKGATSVSAGSTGAQKAAPIPTLVSFTPEPTYTLGRRQTAGSAAILSQNDLKRLKAPLRIENSLSFIPHHEHISTSPGTKDSSEANNLEPAAPEIAHITETSTESSSVTPPSASHHSSHTFIPKIFSSPRGGLATYHGPGQVVLWPILDLRGDGYTTQRSFSVKCYSRLLEETTIALLWRLFGLRGLTTEDPGVWITSSRDGSQVKDGGATRETRKISALGVYLRRYITSLGAAINLDMPATHSASNASSPAVDETRNPWSRFIACGLPGKAVTCIEEELRLAGGTGVPGLEPQVVAGTWAEELVRRLVDRSQFHEHEGEGEMAAEVRIEREARGMIEVVGQDEVEEMMRLAEKAGYLEAAEREEITVE